MVAATVVMMMMVVVFNCGGELWLVVMTLFSNNQT